MLFTCIFSLKIELLGIIISVIYEELNIAINIYWESEFWGFYMMFSFQNTSILVNFVKGLAAS